MDFMNWLMTHAEEYHIDPTRICVGGGSAGGHLATCVATITRYRRCPVWKAVLFNPVIDTVPDSGYANACSMRLSPTELRAISPFHNIEPFDTQVTILHGWEDRVIRFPHMEEYVAACRRMGNDVILIPFRGMAHAFFNFHRRAENGAYYKCRDILVGTLLCD